MTYRVFRQFEGPGGEIFPVGVFLDSPPWPEQNVKALVSQRYIVPRDLPAAGGEVEPPAETKPARRGRKS